MYDKDTGLLINDTAKPDYTNHPKTDTPKLPQDMPVHRSDNREAETGPEINPKAVTSSPAAPNSGPAFEGQQEGYKTRGQRKANPPPRVYQTTDGSVIYTLVSPMTGETLGAVEAEGPDVADYVDMGDNRIFKVTKGLGKAPVIFVTDVEAVTIRERELTAAPGFQGVTKADFTGAALAEFIAAARLAKPVDGSKTVKIVRVEKTDQKPDQKSDKKPLFSKPTV